MEASLDLADFVKPAPSISNSDKLERTSEYCLTIGGGFISLVSDPNSTEDKPQEAQD